MESRSRMVKMLTCLVLAMTGTSAFLAWIDPSPPFVESIPQQRIVEMAWEAVARDVSVANDRWQRVEVVMVPAEPLSGRMLAANAEQSSAHFRVESNGTPDRLDLWADQISDAESPGTVRIEVPQFRRDQPMSPSQWFGVRAIVGALRGSFAPDGNQLPVRMGWGWEDAYGIEPGASVEVLPVSRETMPM